MDNPKPEALAEAHVEYGKTAENAIELGKEDVVEAKKGTDTEHNTTLWQGIRAYQKGIFWSFVFSLCIVMDGYG